MNVLVDLKGPKKESLIKTEFLIIFLHGWGSDGNDLIQLANYWDKDLPSATFLAPNAQEVCSANPNGRQWFEIMNQDSLKMYQDIDKAYFVLIKYIQECLKLYNLEKHNYFLVGFSQGTMLALHTAMRQKCLGILGYSGALIENEANQAVVKNKVLLLHGQLDNIVTVDRMENAYNKLKSFSFDVDKIVFDDLEHSINEEGLKMGKDFIKKNL